jgi:polar amino acid transport system substrate-binding protein
MKLFAILLSLLSLIPSQAMSEKLDLNETLYLVTFNYRPFSVCEHKTLKKSFFKDIVDAACSEAKMSCLVECFPNRRAKSMLKSGAAHGNYPLGWNIDREQWLHRSPSINFAEHIFYKRDSDNINNINDFANKKIGVFGPSNLSWTLDKIQQKMAKTTGEQFDISVLPESNGNNMKKLSFGRIDGVFINGDMGYHQIKDLGIKNVNRAFVFKEYNQYIGYSKEKNTGKRLELINKFNRAIETIKKNGILSNIIQAYEMKDAEPRFD